VKPRRSENITVIRRSTPQRYMSRFETGSASRNGISGRTLRAWSGRIWQASRTPGGASILVSAACSTGFGGASLSAPSMTSTRQVVQRPRPPHTEACGTPAARLISRSVAPGTPRTVRPG
jgi:hypothetical protein